MDTNSPPDVANVKLRGVAVVITEMFFAAGMPVCNVLHCLSI